MLRREHDRAAVRHNSSDPAGSADWDWRHAAACRDDRVNAEVFFPVPERGPALREQEARAKAVCAQCPVIDACRAWARDWLPFGIAGGLTPAERRRDSGRPRRRVRASFDGRHSETADAGRAALRAGVRPVDVAREFGVSDRTVSRWGAANRAEGDAVRRGVA